MKFWNGKETFEKIECPVLLIAGDEDDHAPMVTMVEAADLLEERTPPHRAESMAHGVPG